MSARSLEAPRVRAVLEIGLVALDASARAANYTLGTPERETRRNAWFVWLNKEGCRVTGTGRAEGRAGDLQDVACCQSLAEEEDHGASLLLLEDEDESHQLRVDDEDELHAGSDHSWVVVVEADHHS